MESSSSKGTKPGVLGEMAETLRGLREERRISLRELARRSGISVNALSQIERGLSSPSVSTLYRLVDALGVPIAAVFGATPRREQIVYRRAEDRSRLPLPAGRWEGLGGEDFAGRVQPFILTLDPGGDSGPDAMLHTGHEFVLCLDGLLEYEVEGQRFSLSPGDSLLFSAQLEHRWRNSSPTPTQVLIVLSGFNRGESPLEYHLTSGKESDTEIAG